MLLAIEREKATRIVGDYYGHLAMAGGTKHPVVGRFLFWLFILYFVERIYELLTEEDYNLINKALIMLFSSGDCLFSYKLLRSRKTVVGKPIYMGTFILRGTEDRHIRAAEDERLRASSGQ